MDSHRHVPSRRATNAELETTQVTLNLPAVAQIKLPLLNSAACLEVCNDCTLPAATFGDGALYVSMTTGCASVGTGAGHWILQQVMADALLPSPLIRIIHVPTNKCLTVGNSMAEYYIGAFLVARATHANMWLRHRRCSVR